MQKNPFRYRGYYYDQETSWYYLQSRYYNPEVRRFLNADMQLNTETGVMGHKVFAYCNDDPVNNVDPSGRTFLSFLMFMQGIIGGGQALYNLTIVLEQKEAVRFIVQ